MAEMSDDAVAALRSALGDVHFRANRLHEWREFGIVLEKLRSRYEVVRQRVDADDKSPNSMSSIRDTLRALQDSELIEADSFINSVECISKPLNGATAPLNLADWLQKVTAASSTAESEFNAGNWGTFRDQCQEIRKLVFGMLSKRNLLLESEIGDLRSFSRALKDKF